MFSQGNYMLRVVFLKAYSGRNIENGLGRITTETWRPIRKVAEEARKQN